MKGGFDHQLGWPSALAVFNPVTRKITKRRFEIIITHLTCRKHLLLLNLTPLLSLSRIISNTSP